MKTSALENFIRKIDGKKLNKTAEEYYKDGSIYLTKDQFDDAILEFIKAIRKSSTMKNKEYLSAQAELIRMGFSKEDIKQVRLSPAARRAAALNSHTELAGETINEPQSNVNWLLIKIGSGAIISIIVSAVAANLLKSGCTNSRYLENLPGIFIMTWISWVGISSLGKHKESSSHINSMLISLLVILLGAYPCIILNGVFLIGTCT